MNNSNQLPAVVQTAIQSQNINLSNVNMMLPTQTFGELLGSYDKAVIEVVKIDPNPKNGEVFSISGKKALGKIPLQKIGNALGILWDPENTTILESTYDKARAKATGAIKKPNGEYIILSEEKTVDVQVFQEEQELEAEKGKKIWDDKTKRYKHIPWPTEKEKEIAIKKAVLQYRKFKDERAMTGAKERVIRALIAIKSAYTDAELVKPFAFPRIVTDTSAMLEDPAMRQAAIDKMTGSVKSIFGEKENGNGNGNGDGMKNVTPEPAALPDPDNTEEDRTGVEVAFEQPQEEPAPFEVQKQELTPVEKMREEILTLLENQAIPQDKRDGCLNWLNTNKDSLFEKNLPPVINYLKNLIDKAQIHKLTGGGK